jgi:dihydrofolate reductase
MSKITSSIFISLDGFAADSDNNIRWFKPSDEFFKYSSLLIQNADTAIYGRKTYEMMDAYWPTAAKEPDADWHSIEHGNWYNQSRKIVFSNSLKPSEDEKTLILGENSVERLKQIKQESTKDMVIFGSPSIVGLLTENNLIDEYYIFIAPIILGGGVPVFTNVASQKDFKVLDSKQLPNGAVVLHYAKA